MLTGTPIGVGVSPVGVYTTPGFVASPSAASLSLAKEGPESSLVPKDHVSHATNCTSACELAGSEGLGPKSEPATMRGEVYVHYGHGHVRTLALSGQTTATPAPGQGPLVPDSLAPHNRVVIYVDGIQQSRRDESAEIAKHLQSSSGVGCDMGQPVIAVHEGKTPSPLGDVWRITKDVFTLKQAQLPWANAARLLTRCAKFDPAVKAVHDLVRQSLDARRDVVLTAFSGGGEEVALALQLLSREDKGATRKLIAEHVRVLGLSPAASREDFLLSGLRPENLLVAASRKDPLRRFSSHFVHPLNMFANIPAIAGGLSAVAHLLSHTDMRSHNTQYILAKTITPDGKKPVEAFLNGGMGGEILVP